jgi:hypothetical protein
MFIGRKQWKCAGNSKERIESEKRKKEKQLLKKGENIWIKRNRYLPISIKY